jgi:hypothetical protein
MGRRRPTGPRGAAAERHARPGGAAGAVMEVRGRGYGRVLVCWDEQDVQVRSLSKYMLGVLG